ncbi:hypothetical protein [Kordiimonas sp.]|uniref:hypothetical protein n=1 Tax=Kordiimonas sp. TaxID=1970157 RepID=UPI003A932E37
MADEAGHGAARLAVMQGGGVSSVLVKPMPDTAGLGQCCGFVFASALSVPRLLGLGAAGGVCCCKPGRELRA